MKFGLYLIPTDSTEDFIDNAIANGISLFRVYYGDEPEKWFDKFHRKGVMGVLDFSWQSQNPATLAARMAVVDNLKDHPALAGYDSYDEPNVNATGPETIPGMQMTYDETRKRDGDVLNHPMRCCLAGNGTDISKTPVEIKNTADWIGFDDYEVQNGSPISETRLSDYCEAVKSYSGKPLYTVLQGEEVRRWSNPTSPSGSNFRPTISQMFEMAMKCISHDAREIWWFNFQLPASLHNHIFDCTRMLNNIPEKLTLFGNYSIEASNGAWKRVATLAANTTYVVRPSRLSRWTIDATPAPQSFDYRGAGNRVVDPATWGIPYSSHLPLGTLMVLVRFNTSGIDDRVYSFSDINDQEIKISTAQENAFLELFIVDAAGTTGDNRGTCGVSVFEVKPAIDFNLREHSEKP